MKTKRIIALVTVFCMMFCFAVSAATLKEGSRGSEVVTLQNNLNKLIGANLEADGIFGAKTKEAVKNFQRAYGLDVDGIAGPATQGKINELLTNSGLYYGRVLKKGCKGDDVKRLQSDLNRHNSKYGLDIDGSFGSATKAAVEDFQSEHWLDVDGIAGSETQSQMKKCVENGHTTKQTVSDPPEGTTILDNVNRVKKLSQPYGGWCKSTAVAQALNIMYGYNKYTPRDVNKYDYTAYCNSIDGWTVKGSDDNSYRASYCRDSDNVGRSALVSKIEESLNKGLPIVVTINKPGVRHHWVTVIGKTGDTYKIIESYNGEVTTMKALGADFGLTDYSTPHYGYVSFTRQ